MSGREVVQDLDDQPKVDAYPQRNSELFPRCDRSNWLQPRCCGRAVLYSPAVCRGLIPLRRNLSSLFGGSPKGDAARQPHGLAVAGARGCMLDLERMQVRLSQDKIWQQSLQMSDYPGDGSMLRTPRMVTAAKRSV